MRIMELQSLVQHSGKKKPRKVDKDKIILQNSAHPLKSDICFANGLTIELLCRKKIIKMVLKETLKAEL